MTRSEATSQSHPAGVRDLRARAGFSVSEPYALAEITGGDRVRFLQNQLPADIEALKPEHAVYTAYLDRKGRVTHDAIVHALADRIELIAPKPLLASLLEKLEGFHIREDLSMENREPVVAVWELHGPSTPAVLFRLSGVRVPTQPMRSMELHAGEIPVRYLSDPYTGDVGGHLLVPRDRVEAVRAALCAAGADEGLVEIGEAAMETLRIEGGRPRFGHDMDERTLLLELDQAETMVSFQKGCYLGQETVARVHSRGHVNRMLRGLEIEGDTVPEPGTRVQHDGAPVGDTRSARLSPSLNRVVALAMIRRTAAEPGTVVHLDMGSEHVAARVVDLPLYRPPGPGEEAETLYRKGLEAFKQDQFAEALALFERAVLMNPGHTGAFESAGVSQERLGRLEDAVETMRSLTEIDPENVMAWTNLSRYYAQQGKIDEAEKIKGHVTYLVWKKQAGELAAQKKTKEEDAVRKARLEERIGLFLQVLELDSDDVIANFGLGKVYLDLERYEEALPYLRSAIAHQKDYSMAMNHLGTALSALGRSSEAADVFREGIAAATRRGDLIPKRDMTRKLQELEQER